MSKPTRWWAIPRRENGDDELGTLGVITGSGFHKNNFIQKVKRIKDSDPRMAPHGYNIYFHMTGTNWYKEGTVE